MNWGQCLSLALEANKNPVLSMDYQFSNCLVAEFPRQPPNNTILYSLVTRPGSTRWFQAQGHVDIPKL